jgi:AraC-like DNA-binding protein
MSMCAVFHQFTPAELYIGITEPINTVADTASEAPAPGFRATSYAFLDLFLANLHRHGMHTANYHAALLDIKKIEFCFTLQTLTGMTFTDFTEAYILLMATDLLKAPNKDLKHISKRLGFGSYSGFYRFMLRKGMGKPSWV